MQKPKRDYRVDPQEVEYLRKELKDVEARIDSVGDSSVRCPKCKSSFLMKAGVYWRKRLGLVNQRFGCRECGQKFMVDVSKDDTTPEDIKAYCLALLKQDYDPKHIISIINAMYDLRVHKPSLGLWLEKYAELAGGRTELTIENGKKGKAKRGGK